MNWIKSILIAGVCCRLALFADVVELQDGSRIEGRILAENADSIEIQIGANEAGTIRRVLIIDASEIRTWMADAAGIAPSEPGSEINREGGREYIEKLIREAQLKIDAKEYDDGIREFGQAAELAVRDLSKLEPGQQVGMLELREYASRLQLAALQGKQHLLKQGTEGVEDKLEEMEKNFERDVQKLQEDKKKFQDSLTETQQFRIGSRRAQQELDEREAALKQRQAELISIRQRTVTRLQEIEKEIAETEVQIKLADERVDRAKNETRQAQRALRR